MHPKTAILPIITLLFASSGVSTGQKREENIEGERTIRAEVEMVSLPVVVTNKEGRRIPGLNKEDFKVYENGVQQVIAGFAATDEPVKVVLLLDTSGSTEFKLARIQRAAIDFVNQLHPDDEVAVISFADDVVLQEDFSIDRDRNEYGIKKTRTGDSTVLYEAVWLALEEVLKPIKERTALVLFSDGVDTRSAKASEEETLELSMETRATIYCVYYNTEGDMSNRGVFSPTLGRFPPVVISPLPPISTGPGSSQYDYARGRAYLSQLAEKSGGLLFDGSNDLHQAFGEVAKELAGQYSIGYYSSNPKHDGKFRKIEVKVGDPGYRVRTKKGYYTKKDKKK